MDNLIEELINSEEVYVKQLRVLINTFANPLQSYLTRLKQEGELAHRSTLFSIEKLFDENVDIIKTLFSNIKEICACNEVILANMKESQQHYYGSELKNFDSLHPVVAALIKATPFLKMYGTYVTNFEKAEALLAVLETDARFRAFLHCATEQPQCNGLNIRAFLILPVQRSPRYELLLKEMKKKSKTPAESCKYQEAIDAMCTVISSINSSITKEQHCFQLIDIQNSFNMPLISNENPGRYLIRSGELKKLCRTGYKPFFFVLCNDILFYGEKAQTLKPKPSQNSAPFSGRATTVANMHQTNGKSKYSLHRVLEIKELQIILTPWGEKEDANNSEEITFALRSHDKGFQLQAFSRSEGNAWIEDLIDTKALINQQNNQYIDNQSAPQDKKPAYIRNEVFNMNTEVRSLDSGKHYSIQLQRFSVRDGVDLSSGLILASDLIDESIQRFPKDYEHI